MIPETHENTAENQLTRRINEVEQRYNNAVNELRKINEHLTELVTFKTLSKQQMLQQQLHDCVISFNFDLLRPFMQENNLKLIDAKTYRPQEAGWDLQRYALFHIQNNNDLRMYKFLRSNGFKLEDFKITDRKIVEAAEAELASTKKESLMWQAAKKLRPEDREKVQHLEEIREVVDSAKQFKRG